MPASTTSDYLHQAELNFLLKGTAYTSPATTYIALFTTAPNLAGTGGTEVSTSGTGYARVAMPQGTATWTGPTANVYSNAQDVTFNVPTANWGTIVATGLYDSPTGGNLLMVSPLSAPKTVSNGDGAPRILAGQFTIGRATCP